MNIPINTVSILHHAPLFGATSSLLNCHAADGVSGG